MGLRGRKPNPNAKRRQTTRAGRGVGEMPVHVLRRRLELVGAEQPIADADVVPLAKARGIMSMSTEYPLDVLAAAGLLQTKDEEPGTGKLRADAGARFAALYWRVYGRPARACDLGYRAPDLDAIGLRECGLDQEAIARMEERRVRDMMYALAREGRHVLAVTIAVAVCCKAPRPAQIEPLRQGVRRLTVA